MGWIPEPRVTTRTVPAPPSPSNLSHLAKMCGNTLGRTLSEHLASFHDSARGRADTNWVLISGMVSGADCCDGCEGGGKEGECKWDLEYGLQRSVPSDGALC